MANLRHPLTVVMYLSAILLLSILLYPAYDSYRVSRCTGGSEEYHFESFKCLYEMAPYRAFRYLHKYPPAWKSSAQEITTLVHRKKNIYSDDVLGPLFRTGMIDYKSLNPAWQDMMGATYRLAMRALLCPIGDSTCAQVVRSQDFQYLFSLNH